MWADNEALVDFLNIDYLAAGILSTIKNERILPVTIGVFGDWGSGKSSVLKMVRTAMEADKDTLVVFFNGWQFEGYEDARAALMGTILDEMQDQQRIGEKVKGLAGKLLRRVNWFRLMGLAAKTAVTAATGIPIGVAEALTAAKTAVGNLDVESAEKLLNEAPKEDADPRRSIRDFKKDFEDLLKGSNIKRLVVVIDDLDRCLPSTVIDTLEAIRLFLFVDRTAFIIGADEDLVRHAVRTRFPGAKGTKEDVGDQYLEKLIQVPVRVPALGRAEVELYMSMLFCELHLAYEDVAAVAKALPRRTGSTASAAIIDRNFVAGAVQRAPQYIPSQLDEDLSIVAQVADVLTGGLRGNPRHVKRFLNALLLRTHMAQAREVTLKRRELAKLMLLERLRSSSFTELAGWLDPEGFAPTLNQLEQFVRDEGNITAAPAANRSQPPKAAEAQSEPVEKEKPSAKVGSSATQVAPPTAAPGPVAHWLEDEWLTKWLSLDPPLGKTDLRDYFFFARESIGPLSSAISQLSPKAQKLRKALTSPVDATRQAALKEAPSLADVEASQLFNVLAEETRRTEELGGKGSPLSALVLLAKARPELVGEVLTALNGLNESRIPGATPVELLDLTKGSSHATRGRSLVEKWEKSPNKKLAAGAAGALRMEKQKGASKPPMGRGR